MKVKKKAMPVLQKIFYIISFIFLICAFMYLGTKDFNAPKKSLTDAESFQAEYNITVDNIYKYKSSKEIAELLTNGDAIIFMGYKENKWSAVIAELLNETAKQANLDTIYYYNFKKDRNNNNHYYEEIVKILRPNLPHLEDEAVNLYAPTVLAVRNGVITFFDDETSIVRGNKDIDEYWTKEKKEAKKKEYLQMMQQYIKSGVKDE